MPRQYSKLTENFKDVPAPPASKPLAQLGHMTLVEQDDTPQKIGTRFLSGLLLGGGDSQDAATHLGALTGAFPDPSDANTIALKGMPLIMGMARKVYRGTGDADKVLPPATQLPPKLDTSAKISQMIEEYLAKISALLGQAGGPR